MPDDDWRDVIETNLSSVFYTCRAVTRAMMKKRSFSIAGHRTSVALEAEFWTALEDEAREDEVSLAALIGSIDGAREGRNLASALRVHVLMHALGEDAKRVRFLDMDELGRRTARRGLGGARRAGHLAGDRRLNDPTNLTGRTASASPQPVPPRLLAQGANM